MVLRITMSFTFSFKPKAIRENDKSDLRSLVGAGQGFEGCKECIRLYYNVYSESVKQPPRN